jgi:hypothetical protein
MLMKGIEKVAGEISLSILAYNIRRVINIVVSGVEVWHKGAFIKRWKYWEYVLGIAVDYMIKKYLL